MPESACATPVAEGMEIKTDTERVINARKTMLELLLSDHVQDCLTCEKAGNCKLQDLCFEYDVKETGYYGIMNSFPIDDSSEFYTRDINKCVNCRRCVNVCAFYQCTDAVDFAGRGFSAHVAVPFEELVRDSICISCGASKTAFRCRLC